MTRRIKTYVLAAALLAASACSTPDTPRFRFHEDGTFRIMQVTDAHIDWDNQEEYPKTEAQLREMLQTCRPDLVILTGDIVTETAGLDVPWQEFLKPLDESGVPFAITYGNHDRESVLMDTRMAELITAHPSCITTARNGYIDDMNIEIGSSDGSRTAAVLYVMDSGDYSSVAPEGEYGWLPMSQLKWYDDLSKAYALANGGCPVPSYMFMHIPLCEYRQAYETGLVEGSRDEHECPGEVNSGMFSLMLMNADVHGVFCGHDHDNDYLASMDGVGLVYGRFSGDATTSTHGKQGLRFIELHEGDYGFRTWIRERNGDIIYDNSFDPGLDYTLRKACSAEGREHGVTFKWSDSEEETVPMPRHECRHSESPHGFSYKGYIYIPQTGLWRFRTGERDNGRVCIDDVQLNTQESCVTDINLEKGFHRLDVSAWIENGGRSDFKLTWMAPGTDRLRDVPAEYFYVK